MCMRKFQSFAFAGAIALAGAAGLTACSSDDAAEAPINPTFDGESVKTAFAINVAAPSKGGTRMNDENTQNKNNYLGMSNIYLFPMILGNSQVPDASSDIRTKIVLQAPAVYGVSSSNTTKSSYIYSDISIPVGTDNFMFYAMRNQVADASSQTSDKFTKGYISSNLNENIAKLSDISFGLGNVFDNNNSSDYESVKTDFLEYLNTNILGAKANYNSTDYAWKDSQDPILKDAYTQFTTVSISKRAGSAVAICRMMGDLYAVMDARSKVTGTDEATQQAVAIANAVKTAITNGVNGKFTLVTTSSSTTDVLKFASNSEEKYRTFPATFNLPDGAVQLKYDNNAFAYVDDPSVGESDKIVGLNNLYYPACIAYYVNTPAKATDKEIQTTEWQATTTNWDNWSEWNSWTDAVAPTTRSIALKNNINYGVACLKSTIVAKSSTLEDNTASFTSSSTNQNVNIATGEGFKVTGIFIGGQPTTVNWRYVNENQSATKGVVWDNKWAVTDKVSTGESKPNYTLVFDNYTADNTGQEKVNVALEIENNATDFYGKDGLIAKGQKFYLVGQLDFSQGGTAQASSVIDWPEYGSGTGSFIIPTSYEQRYPAKKGINRVFVQDFTTTANFKIANLKNAYVTIPDLRASKLQLGLSVDLTWQTGLTFDVNL